VFVFPAGRKNELVVRISAALGNNVNNDAGYLRDSASPLEIRTPFDRFGHRLSFIPHIDANKVYEKCRASAERSPFESVVSLVHKCPISSQGKARVVAELTPMQFTSVAVAKTHKLQIIMFEAR
jgi:hypothetical protein